MVSLECCLEALLDVRDYCCKYYETRSPPFFKVLVDLTGYLVVTGIRLLFFMNIFLSGLVFASLKLLREFVVIIVPS